MSSRKPLQLLVWKKVKVPTKKQYYHMWRSDWKLTHGTRFGYEDIRRLFKYFDGTIETDAQFLKIVYDRCGPGDYYIQGIRKGRCGFWNFMRVELFDDGFKRKKRKESQEERDYREAKNKFN